MGRKKKKKKRKPKRREGQRDQVSRVDAGHSRGTWKTWVCVAFGPPGVHHVTQSAGHTFRTILMPTLSISAGPMLGAELGVQPFRRDQAPNHSLKAARPRNSSYNPGILIRVGLGVSHYPASLYG